MITAMEDTLLSEIENATGQSNSSESGTVNITIEDDSDVDLQRKEFTDITVEDFFANVNTYM